MTGFRDLIQQIERVTGNVIVARDLTALKRVVDGRVTATGSSSLEGYLELLRDDRSGAEWRHLISHITVKESYLFRGHQQCEALSSDVVPQLGREVSPEIPIRVWSAGCARGEEAATLAIVMAESRHLVGRRWQILGTDVDESALEAASRARFGQRAVSHVSPALLARYFIKRGEEYELVPILRERIEYRYLNLVRDTLPVEAGSFHLILLRNVLIYFRQSSQRRVVAEAARALAGNGWLFLGPTEAMWTISKVLAPWELRGCFAYRHPTLPPALEGVHSSGRRERRTRLGGKTGSSPRASGARLTPNSALVTPPQGESSTPDLLELASLVGSLKHGDGGETRDRLRAFTKTNPAGAEAYLLLGITCDLQGEIESAVEAYRGAVYLEPDLFHARYLLAESLRKLGWRERAAGEYRRVIALLSAGGGVPSLYASQLSLPDRAQVLVRSQAALDPGTS